MIRFVARVHLLDNIGHMVHVYFTIALNCAEKNSELIIVEQIVVVSIVGVVKIVHTLAVALDCIPENSKLVLRYQPDVFDSSCIDQGEFSSCSGQAQFDLINYFDRFIESSAIACGEFFSGEVGTVVVITILEQSLADFSILEVGCVELKELLVAELFVLVQAVERIIQFYSRSRALVDLVDRLDVDILIRVAVAVLEFVHSQESISVSIAPAI